jgi:exodeoxyribonuclease VIII
MENEVLLPQILGPDVFRNSWHRSLSNEDYHAKKGFVSSSMLRDFKNSPHEFKYRHILGKKLDATDAMHLGTAVHMAILEPEEFARRHVIQPTFSGTGMRAAKAEWLANLPEGTLILKQEDADTVAYIAESVAEHKEASQMIKLCMKEQSGFYRDPETGILCRFRPDLCNPKLGLLADVKTTRDHRVEAFSRAAYFSSYHIQLAMYAYGIEQITGVRVKVPMLLACNTSEPYEVALYTCDDEMMLKGKQQYHDLMNRLKTCLEAGVWPRYQVQNCMISLPKWAMYE